VPIDVLISDSCCGIEYCKEATEASQKTTVYGTQLKPYSYS
jgi:hypothetical protein